MICSLFSYLPFNSCENDKKAVQFKKMDLRGMCYEED